MFTVAVKLALTELTGMRKLHAGVLLTLHFFDGGFLSVWGGGGGVVVAVAAHHS